MMDKRQTYNKKDWVAAPFLTVRDDGYVCSVIAREWNDRRNPEKTGSPRLLRSLAMTLLFLLTIFFISPAHAADCTNPAGAEGTVIYNETASVMQFCNGTDWIAMGPLRSGGSPGAGCTSPAGITGEMRYNNDEAVMQYCNGRQWVGIRKTGCEMQGNLAGLFTDQTTLPLSTLVASNIGQVTGLGCNFTINIAGSNGSPQYRICSDGSSEANCDGSEIETWTNAANTITDGQYVQLRMTTAGTGNTKRKAFLTVGPKNDQWDLVTLDNEPDAFDFTDQTDVSQNALITSNILQITSIDNGIPINVTGSSSPQFRTCSNNDCSTEVLTWGSSADTIDNNQYVQLRQTSSASASTQTTATLTVGTVNDDWNVTTNSCAAGSQVVTPVIPAIVGTPTTVSEGTAAASWTHSHTIPVSGNSSRRLIIALHWHSTSATRSPDTITFGGVTLTLIADPPPSTISSDVLVYEIAESDIAGSFTEGNSYDVEVDFAEAVDGMTTVMLIEDATQGSLVGAGSNANAGGSSAAVSTNITPSSANSLVLGFMTWANNLDTGTPTSPQSELYDIAVDSKRNLASEVVADATAQTIEWTPSSGINGWAQGVVAIAPNATVTIPDTCTTVTVKAWGAGGGGGAASTVSGDDNGGAGGAGGYAQATFTLSGGDNDLNVIVGTGGLRGDTPTSDGGNAAGGGGYTLVEKDSDGTDLIIVGAGGGGGGGDGVASATPGAGGAGGGTTGVSGTAPDGGCTVATGGDQASGGTGSDAGGANGGSLAGGAGGAETTDSRGGTPGGGNGGDSDTDGGGGGAGYFGGGGGGSEKTGTTCNASGGGGGGSSWITSSFTPTSTQNTAGSGTTPPNTGDGDYGGGAGVGGTGDTAAGSNDATDGGNGRVVVTWSE